MGMGSPYHFRKIVRLDTIRTHSTRFLYAKRYLSRKPYIYEQRVKLNNINTFSDYNHVHKACKQINVQLNLGFYLSEHVFTFKDTVRIRFCSP